MNKILLKIVLSCIIISAHLSLWSKQFEGENGIFANPYIIKNTIQSDTENQETENVNITEIIVNGDTITNKNKYIYEATCGEIEIEIKIQTDAQASIFLTINGIEKSTQNTVLNQTFFNINIEELIFGVNTILVDAVSGIDTTQINFTIIRPIPFDNIVKKRWNNTFTVINNPANNGGYEFKSYQWFRNGHAVGNNQFFSEGSNGEALIPEDVFYVIVVTINDDTIKSCPSSLQNEILDFSVYPNPINSGNFLTIVFDIEETQLNDATVELYNRWGVCMQIKRVTSMPITIFVNDEYPEGAYIVVLKDSNNIMIGNKLILILND